jgi:hypothetical protein
MAEIKGKFITLTVILMQNKPEVQAKADEFLVNETGLSHLELDPEDYYDVKLWDNTMTLYKSAYQIR